MILLILTEHFTSLAAFAAAAALVLCLVGCGELFEKPDTLCHAALMMTDLDNLKTINDTYGHDWGDIYLRQTAHSLRQGSPSGTVVARLSGDEFLLLFYGYETREAPCGRTSRSWKRTLPRAVLLCRTARVYASGCPATEPVAIDEKAAEVIAEVERQKAEREEAGP